MQEDMFSFQLRLIYMKWRIFVDGVVYTFPNWRNASKAKDILLSMGYVDRDRLTAE